MDKKTSTGALVESSLLTAITIVIIFINVYVPFVSVVGVFLWPIPITLVYIKNGFKYSLMSTIVTAIIVLMFLGPIRALVFIGGYGLLGLVLGYCINNKKPVVTTIILMAGTTLLTSIISLKGVFLFTGQDTIKQTLSQFAQSADMVKDIYIKAGLPKEKVNNMINIDAMMQLVGIVIPALLLIASAIISIINYLFTQSILKRFKYNIESIPSLHKWYIPFKVQSILIGSMLLMYILTWLKVPNTSNYFANLFIIFLIVFVVNGFAAFDNLLTQRNIKRGIRIGILVFIAFTPISNILFFVGIFDYIFDTRRLDPDRRRTA